MHGGEYSERFASTRGKPAHLVRFISIHQPDVERSWLTKFIHVTTFKKQTLKTGVKKVYSHFSRLCPYREGDVVLGAPILHVSFRFYSALSFVSIFISVRLQISCLAESAKTMYRAQKYENIIFMAKNYIASR